MIYVNVSNVMIFLHQLTGIRIKSFTKIRFAAAIGMLGENL